MKRLFTILLFLFFLSCKEKTENKINSQLHEETNFDNYFKQYEIKPAVIVYNIEGNQTEIEISNHSIIWINTDDETKVKIDGDLFTLKDKETQNVVWGNKDSVDFANNWDEIKLFKIDGRQIIGIRMSFKPCVGLGCGVDYFLIYDIETKNKSFFGTFRTDNTLALYDFHNDDKIDYVSKAYSGDAHGSTPIELIYELYSMEDNGYFTQQKNISGETYQIKQTTFPYDPSKTEKIEYRWIREIK